MCPAESRSAPEDLIRARIASEGKLTFAAFMDAALYGPGGYYTKPGRISPGGDFFTSPAAHPAFGALITVQLRDFWRALGRPAAFHAVEMGAGDGGLARDVTGYAPRLDPEFAHALRYVAVEQRERGAPGVEHAPPRSVTGCVLSNELLDAFPVHRFVVERGEVRELFVALRSGEFVETPGPVSDPQIEARISPLLPALPDGYTGEVCLKLDAWAGEVSDILERGYVLTVDYGWPAGELYRPDRAGGSLRCYYRHTLSQDPFRRIGNQDITAHVDFSVLNAALTSAGLTPLGLTSQAEFLERLGLRALLRGLRSAGLPQAEADANRMAMLELVKPDGLGRFRVAVHAKGASGSPAGLDSAGLPGDEADALPLPLLDSDEGHFDLMRGRYPESGWVTGTWDELLGGDEE
ncbi:MAG: SAM-dependent methyltransferase [Dehalococcoidia bacterium]